MKENFETSPHPQETLTVKQGENLIKVIDMEGQEREINLDNIKNHWIDFYQNHNLPEIVEALREIKIQLTNQQVEEIKTSVQKGFDFIMLLPPVELQKKLLNKIVQETSKEFKEVPEAQQYSKKGILLDSNLENSWRPGNIAAKKMTVLHRPPNQPYLVLLKDTLEVEEDTLNRSARELRNPQLQSYLEGENKPNIGTLLSIYNEGKENSGLTSAEYFVFQKDFLIRHGVHPDTTNGTILLSTERRYISEPNELPVATWNKNDHRIHLFSQSKMSSSSTIGTRFTKIYKISS